MSNKRCDIVHVQIMNTPKQGTFRHIVFKDKGVWYAVALEFNIVESADDPKLAFFNMLQATSGYIDAMKKIKGATKFAALNQKADAEYEALWKNLHAPKPVKSPYQVAMYGVASV